MSGLRRRHAALSNQVEHGFLRVIYRDSRLTSTQRPGQFGDPSAYMIVADSKSGSSNAVAVSSYLIKTSARGCVFDYSASLTGSNSYAEGPQKANCPFPPF